MHIVAKTFEIYFLAKISSTLVLFWQKLRIAISHCFIWQLSRDCCSIVLNSLFRFSVIARKSYMTGSTRIFEKLNFTPKLSALAFLKVKLPNMTDWHIPTSLIFGWTWSSLFFGWRAWYRELAPIMWIIEIWGNPGYLVETYDLMHMYHTTRSYDLFNRFNKFNKY